MDDPLLFVLYTHLGVTATNRGLAEESGRAVVTPKRVGKLVEIRFR